MLLFCVVVFVCLCLLCFFCCAGVVTALFWDNEKLCNLEREKDGEGGGDSILYMSGNEGETTVKTYVFI